MRDYSHQATRHRGQTAKRPGKSLGVTLAALVIAAFFASLFYLNDLGQSKEQATSEPSSTEPAPGSDPAPIDETRDPPALAAAPAHTPTNGLSFHQILQDAQILIDAEPGQSRDQAVAEQLKTTRLQIASFKQPESAEDLRITLSFLDLDPQVIPASASNGWYYRVVVGPFESIRELQSAADRLKKNGYDALSVRE